MKKLLVILVALAMLTGCGAGMFNNGAKIAVKNHESKKISLTDAIDELNTQYGEPIAHYRGYKDSEDKAHVIKDLYYSANDGRTLVTVTVIDDEVTQIITTKR